MNEETNAARLSRFFYKTLYGQVDVIIPSDTMHGTL